jgi:hypothetical protein
MEPLRVWKVELASGLAAHDVAGKLRLADDAVVFVPTEGAGEAPIPFASMRRVKRLRLTAVLLIRWVDDREVRETAFYLTKPPPLHRSTKAETETAVGLGRIIRYGKRTQQRRNSAYLAEVGTLMKPTLKEWVRELDTRIAATRGS